MLRKGFLLSGVLSVTLMLTAVGGVVKAEQQYSGRAAGQRLRALSGVTTSSERLNQSIANGSAQVYEYVEPSQKEKAKIDARLMELGYPKEIIADTPWSTKEDWLELDLPYEAWQNNSGDGSKDGGVGINRLDDEGYMTWSYALQDQSTTTKRKYKLTSTFDWNQNPFWHLTDKIVWGWDASTTSGDDLFAYDGNSVRNTYYVKGCGEMGLGCTTIALTWNNVVDGEPGGGEATEIDLINGFVRNGSTYGTVDTWGTASITVSKNKLAGEHGSWASISKYYHQLAGCTDFSISFADAPESSVGCALGVGAQSTTDKHQNRTW